MADKSCENCEHHRAAGEIVQQPVKAPGYCTAHPPGFVQTGMGAAVGFPWLNQPAETRCGEHEPRGVAGAVAKALGFGGGKGGGGRGGKKP